MTDNINDLIAQRDALDRQITAIQEKKATERNDAWMTIDLALEQRVSGRWRKNDYIFELPGITVTLVNRTEPSTYMVMTWDGYNRAEFSDPPPVATVLAFIDAFKAE